MHCHPPSSTLFPYTTLFRSTLRVSARGMMRAWAQSITAALLVVLVATLATVTATSDTGEARSTGSVRMRSEEHTSELQSPCNLVCRLLLEKKKKKEYRSQQL